MMGGCTPQNPSYMYVATPNGMVKEEDHTLAATKRDDSSKRTGDAAGLTDGNASPSKKLRVAAHTDDKAFHIIPFDASREWWSFKCVSDTHVVSLLFDPASVSAAKRDELAAFICSDSAAIWDINSMVYGDETDQDIEYDVRICGAWAGFPSNEHLKASKECVKITVEFIETRRVAVFC